MGNNDYFLAALANMIDTGKHAQSDISARSGIARQTINAYYKRRKTPGMVNQEAIASACEMTHADFIKHGKEVVDGPTVAISSPPQAIPTNYIDTDAIVPFAQTLAVQMAKTRDRMHFWKEVYEVLPAATLIIKDGVVVYQNSASRSLGLTVGTDLCDSCISAGTEHCGGDNCPIKKSSVTGQVEKQFKAVGGVDFCLIAAPMRYSGCEYFIALAVDITKPKPDEVNP